MIVHHLVSSYVDSQLESIRGVGGVLPFLVEKLQERNPLSSSIEYHKQSKILKKHLVRLIAIKRDYTKYLQQNDNNSELHIRLHHVKQRIVELKIELNFLESQEKTYKLLKWSSPCNLIVPGSGDSIRVVAYSMKVFNALNYHLQKSDNLSEMRKVAKEISLASSLSFISNVVYNKVRTLKEYLSYSSFRSLIYSSLDV